MIKVLFGCILISGLFTAGAFAGDLREFKLQASCADDPLIEEIEKDMTGKSSVLALLRSYAQELAKDAGRDSPYLRKLERLFMCGRAESAMDGYFAGLPLVLKMGNQPHGEILNTLWNTTLSQSSPWKGKSFEPIEPKDLEFYTRGSERDADSTFLGINCFKEYEEFLNVVSMQVLSFWMNLKEAPMQEKLAYGYDKRGGLFIARKALSVDRGGSDKEVFQLNYRWQNLNNPPPISSLIDETVEIAEGLYLGKLLLAQNTWDPYDPQKDASVYRYENFGYFLLWSERWQRKAR